MTFIYFVLLGVLGGVLAGMGMGGGTLTLPLLVLVMGVEQITAQFANLIAFLPSGSVALFLHVKNKLVGADSLLFLLPSSIVSCALSSYFATQINDDILRRLFGAFLLTIAIFSLVAKILPKNR